MNFPLGPFVRTIPFVFDSNFARIHRSFGISCLFSSDFGSLLCLNQSLIPYCPRLFSCLGGGWSVCPSVGLFCLSVLIRIFRNQILCVYLLLFLFLSLRNCTAEPRSYGPALNGIPPLTDAVFLSLQSILVFFSNIGYNKIPPIIVKIC